MTTAYQIALRALGEGKVVILTPGVDSDGDKVICTSMFQVGHHGDAHLLNPEPGVRAACLLGIARAAREGLRERHGIRCS